jgi:hypothetical protein
MLTSPCVLRSRPDKLSPEQIHSWSAFVISRETIAMRWPEFVRSTTLRWTALLAAIFAAFVVAMLGFVYLKIKHDLTIRYDRSIRSQMGVLALLSPPRRLDAIDDSLRQDPAQVRLSGLFEANGHRIAGNLESLPLDLKADIRCKAPWSTG